jgi:hypothetical protein
LNDFILLEQLPKDKPKFALPNEKRETQFKLRVASIPVDKEVPFQVGDTVYVHKHAVLDYADGDGYIIYVRINDIVGVER